MAVLENWVKLVYGVPKRLHFINHLVQPRQFTNPITKMQETRQSLVFSVDREDGTPVSKSFSVMSEKLANDLSGYLIDHRYRGYEFIIVKDAPGPVAPRVAGVHPIVM
jgi:hypothetical protein